MVRFHASATINTGMLCPNCKNEYTSKDKRQVYCSKTCSTQFTNKLRKPKPKKNKTKTCETCSASFEYRYSKHQKYCTHTCAAVATNAKRVYPPKQKYIRPKSTPKPPKIRERTCQVCGRIDTLVGRGGRFTSTKCKFCDDSLTYRNECTFTFDLRNFPDEFDLTLLVQHGMFNPKSNPNGVVRDHKLSIYDGKKLRLDPKLLAHPANCELMLQRDNMRKLKSSSITIVDLIEAIETWDKKYMPTQLT